MKSIIVMMKVTLYVLPKPLRLNQSKKTIPMINELPDSKIPWWDNHYEDTYTEEVEDGYPYDIGTKVQE